MNREVYFWTSTYAYNDIMATIHATVSMRNYRCFDWHNPATLEFGEAFVAYVGPNNVGKSSALRAIYELRNCWPAVISTFHASSNFRHTASWNGVSDPSELANDADPKRFEITITLEELEFGDRNFTIAKSITLAFDVANSVMTSKQVVSYDSAGNITTLSADDLKNVTGTNGLLFQFGPGSKFTDFTQLNLFLLELHKAKYFPAFRNAINEGAGIYYDLPVGTALVNSWDSWSLS